jgi:hypothetical protein
MKTMLGKFILAMSFGAMWCPAPAQAKEGSSVGVLEKLRAGRGTTKSGVRACAKDIEKWCNDVEPGQGRVGACLNKNLDRLSAPCRKFARHGGPGHEPESLGEIDRSYTSIPGAGTPAEQKK